MRGWIDKSLNPTYFLPRSSTSPKSYCISSCAKLKGNTMESAATTASFPKIASTRIAASAFLWRTSNYVRGGLLGQTVCNINNNRPRINLTLAAKRGKRKTNSGKVPPPPSQGVGGEETPGLLYTDEWGEKSESPDETSELRVTGTVPENNDEDEWGGSSSFQIKGEGEGEGEGDSTSIAGEIEGLKRNLVGCFYGTQYGLRASTQTRAHIAELISQLEAINPNPAPTTESLSLLDGNWILLYTPFSELLPLVAAGTLPFVKLEKIIQQINTNKFTVENSATYSGPLGSLSFKALATFEVSSPQRIKVKFEEGIFPPPDVKNNFTMPGNIQVLGQNIDSSSLQSILNPLQDAAMRTSQVISGLPPLKVSLGSRGAESWLLTTYLDQDLRISRGDGGGLFVLAKEGSLISNFDA